MSEKPVDHEFVYENKDDFFIDNVNPDLVSDRKIVGIFEMMAVCREWCDSCTERFGLFEGGVARLDGGNTDLFLSEALKMGEMYEDFRDWIGGGSDSDELFQNSKKNAIEVLGDGWDYPKNAQKLDARLFDGSGDKPLYLLRHSFGTPFGVIYGYAQLIDMGVSEESKSDYIRQMAGGVTRLRTIIKGGADYVRSRFLNEKSEVAPISIDNLNASFEEVFRNQVSEHFKLLNKGNDSRSPVVNIEKQVSGSDSIEWSWHWIDLLTDYVASNAVKAHASRTSVESDFTDPLRVDVRFQDYSDGDVSYVDIVFEDNGTGFPDEILENGFGMNKTKWAGENVEGTGQGMATLEEQLPAGGKFIAEKRPDGKPGARLIARLPKVSG